MTQFIIPLKTVSEANAHEHWRARQKRAKSQRGAAFMYAVSFGAKAFRGIAAPIVVIITRIAPRGLDDDNLASSQKHVRDGIADALEVNDRDPRVSWVYRQRRGGKSQLAVEVSIARAEDA